MFRMTFQGTVVGAVCTLGLVGCAAQMGAAGPGRPNASAMLDDVVAACRDREARTGAFRAVCEVHIRGSVLDWEPGKVYELKTSLEATVAGERFNIAEQYQVVHYPAPGDPGQIVTHYNVAAFNGERHILHDPERNTARIEASPRSYQTNPRNLWLAYHGTPVDELLKVPGVTGIGTEVVSGKRCVGFHVPFVGQDGVVDPSRARRLWFSPEDDYFPMRLESGSVAEDGAFTPTSWTETEELAYTHDGVPYPLRARSMLFFDMDDADELEFIAERAYSMHEFKANIPVSAETFAIELPPGVYVQDETREAPARGPSCSPRSAPSSLRTAP